MFFGARVSMVDFVATASEIDDVDSAFEFCDVFLENCVWIGGWAVISAVNPQDSVVVGHFAQVVLYLRFDLAREFGDRTTVAHPQSAPLLVDVIEFRGECAPLEAPHDGHLFCEPCAVMGVVRIVGLEHHEVVPVDGVAQQPHSF